MAWAIFHEFYTHDFRPAAAQSRDFHPSEKPQKVTKAILEAAVAAGRATEHVPDKEQPSGKGAPEDD